ncbi:MAG TPA: hypothetical protein VKQ32_19375 [Polyangia bacterium]|nr:hypothetical protein [Polyangia bacterium]
MFPGGALLAALLSQSAPGAAPEAATTTVRLDGRGAAECTPRSDLAARVAARTPRVQFADDGAVHAEVAVTSARPGNVVAELVLGPARAEAPRRVVARSCAEAADAIALIIAVTLDPTLKGSAPATSSAPPPAVKPPAEAVVAKPPAPAVESPARAVATPASATKRRFGVAVAGQTIFGPAPNVMPGIALYVMAALDRGGAWSPALFVGATRVWRDDLSQPGGSASFTLDAASVDACPIRLAGSALTVHPCASALVGRMASSGADTGNGVSTARPFAVAGAAIAARFGVTASIELSLRLAAGVTLIRDSYQFGATTFHRADPVTTSASLGIGTRW